jgi:hypothetical protein
MAFVYGETDQWGTRHEEKHAHHYHPLWVFREPQSSTPPTLPLPKRLRVKIFSWLIEKGKKKNLVLFLSLSL